MFGCIVGVSFGAFSVAFGGLLGGSLVFLGVFERFVSVNMESLSKLRSKKTWNFTKGSPGC